MIENGGGRVHSSTKNYEDAAFFLLVMTLVMLIFFFAMWGIGWANCALIPDKNYCDDLVGVSFSAMLEKISGMKIVYVLWLVVYGTFNKFGTMVIVITYKPVSPPPSSQKEDDKKHTFPYATVDAMTTLYCVFSVAMIICLSLVPVYDVSTDGVPHLIVAGVAFGSGVMSTWALFIRRFLIIRYHHHDEANKLPDSYRKKSNILLFINFLCVLFGLAMIISFAITSIGLLEFFLTLYIVVDELWQIYDVGNNPLAPDHHYDGLMKLKRTLRRVVIS
jgi:hypothetical protein